MKIFKFFTVIAITLLFNTISFTQVQDFNLTAPAINPNPLEFPGVGTYQFSVGNVQGTYTAGCATITIEMDKVAPVDGANSVSSSIPDSKWSWELVDDKLIGTQIEIVNEFLYSETFTVAIDVIEGSVEPGTNGFIATIATDCGDGNATNNVASSYTWTVDPPLVVPVELVSFDVSKVKSNALVEWTTASELNNSHFEIERSEDGTEFEKIGEVEGSGDSNRLLNYNFVDRNPAKGYNYYRLQQVDFDGRTTTSEIKFVSFEDFSEERDSYSVYPNPTTEYLFVKGLLEGDRIQLFNLTGALLLEMDASTTQQIFVGDLESGTYLMSAISSDGELLTTERIVILK
jgi:hypothetical protein